jgi:glutamate carboxypeptidase
VNSSLDIDQMLIDLELLVQTESPSRDIERLAVSAEILSRIITDRLGHPPRVIESSTGPHVHWQSDGKPSVLLLGHHDTVFPAGTTSVRPFSLNGGRALGPGVLDMKAGIVVGIHAVATLDDQSGVELLITADEEVGSLSSRRFVEQRALACGTVLVLEPGTRDGALKTGRKGSGRFEVVVHGRAAHAGLEPEKGVNSLVAATELIAWITRNADPQIGTTLTPTTIVGGTAGNVVPAETRFRIDARVSTAAEQTRVESLMAGLTSSVAGASVEVTGCILRPPMPESSSSSLFARACSVADRLGLGSLRGAIVGGGSDGSFTAAIGVPTLDGMGAIGAGPHAAHEYVDIGSLIDRARLVAGMITDCKK